MSGGTAKGARRRDLIAEAAAALVLDRGPAALSHRAVAARAGVPLAATTYYFRDLDELAAVAGVAATRRSPGLLSFGTPILIGSPSGRGCAGRCACHSPGHPAELVGEQAQDHGPTSAA